MIESMSNEPLGTHPGPTARLYKALSSIIKKHGVKVVAAETRLSQATAYRWSGDYNADLPNPDLVLSLLQFDSKINQVDLISNHYGPIIKWFLEKSFPHEFEIPYEISELTTLIDNEYEYFVAILCGTGKIITENQIILRIGEIIAKRANIPEELLTSAQVELLGATALEPIQSLVKKGVLKKEPNGYIRTKLNIHVPSTKVNLDNTMELLKNIINPKLWPTGVNAFQSFTTSLEEDHRVIIAEQLSKALIQIEKYAKEHESFSETASPIMVGIFSESMLSSTENRHRTNQ